MTLLTILIALYLEKKINISKQIKLHLILDDLYNKVFNKYLNKTKRDYFIYFLLAFSPTFLIWGYLNLITGIYFGIIKFISLVFLFYIIIGCPNYRKIYQDFQDKKSIDLANKECSLISQKIIKEIKFNLHDQKDNLGMISVWIMYSYYASIILITGIFGIYTAVFYVCLRTLLQKRQVTGKIEKIFYFIIHILDFIPVRIVALCFSFVGDFTKSFPHFTRVIFNYKIKAQNLLSLVAHRSSDYEIIKHSCFVEVKHILVLSNRVLICLLCFLAALSLHGAIV